MVKIENLQVELGGKKILNEVSYSFEAGKFTSILGPNGSGKSTLIKTIAGTIKKSGGKVIIFDEEKTKFNKHSFAKKMAFLFQFNSSTQGITVREMISFGRTPHKSMFKPLTKKDHEIINEAIELTDLSDYADRELANLSGGEKQRVHLAMCIAQQPEILILDEPTNHLDVKYQFQLLGLVRKLNLEKKMTVICVLHDINQALKYSDNLIVMNKGKIHCQGITKKCVDCKMIKDVFEVDTIIHEDNNGLHVDYLIEDNLL